MVNNFFNFFWKLQKILLFFLKKDLITQNNIDTFYSLLDLISKSMS